MKSKWAIARLVAVVAVVAVVGAALYGGTVLATPPTPFPGLTTAILAQSTLDNAKKFQFAQALLRSRQLFGTSDFYVVDNKFEANATTGWRSHPGLQRGHDRGGHDDELRKQEQGPAREAGLQQGRQLRRRRRER